MDLNAQIKGSTTQTIVRTILEDAGYQSIRRIGFFLFFLIFLAGCHTSKEGKEAPASITPQGNYETPTDAVKTFFDAVNNQQYDVAWQSLTKKSKNKLVSMVAEDENMDPTKVRELFDQNLLPIQLGFWKSFRESSKVASIVPNATYKKLSDNGYEAIVELSSETVTFDNIAIKESDGWKWGYIESFMYLKDDTSTNEITKSINEDPKCSGEKRNAFLQLNQEWMFGEIFSSLKVKSNVIEYYNDSDDNKPEMLIRKEAEEYLVSSVKKGTDYFVDFVTSSHNDLDLCNKIGSFPVQSLGKPDKVDLNSIKKIWFCGQLYYSNYPISISEEDKIRLSQLALQAGFPSPRFTMKCMSQFGINSEALSFNTVSPNSTQESIDQPQEETKNVKTNDAVSENEEPNSQNDFKSILIKLRDNYKELENLDPEKVEETKSKITLQLVKLVKTFYEDPENEKLIGLSPHSILTSPIFGFFSALSKANGKDAIKFIIPDKRNTGAYKADEMTNYYSKLEKPISLLDIYGPISGNSFYVAFTSKETGQENNPILAKVDLENINGTWLISKISHLVTNTKTKIVDLTGNINDSGDKHQPDANDIPVHKDQITPTTFNNFETLEALSESEGLNQEQKKEQTNVKKEARKNLENKYYVKYNNCDELKKAIHKNVIEEVQLFLAAGANVSYDNLSDAIEAGFKRGDWGLFTLVVSYPKNVKPYSCEEVETQPPHISQPPYHFIEQFNAHIINLNQECSYQDLLANNFFHNWDSPWNYESGCYNVIGRFGSCGNILVPSWNSKKAEETFCQGTLKIYLSKYPESAGEYLNSIGNVMRRCFENESSCPLHGHFWDETNQEYILKTIDYLKSLVEQKCQKNKLEDCKVLKDFSEDVESKYALAKSTHTEEKTKNTQAKLAEERAVARSNSPEGIQDNACHLSKLIKDAEERIDYQQKIGAASGVVNKEVLYKAGQLKVYAEERLSQLKSDYFHKTGRSLNLEICK